MIGWQFTHMWTHFINQSIRVRQWDTLQQDLRVHWSSARPPFHANCSSAQTWKPMWSHIQMTTHCRKSQCRPCAVAVGSANGPERRDHEWANAHGKVRMAWECSGYTGSWKTPLSRVVPVILSHMSELWTGEIVTHICIGPSSRRFRGTEKLDSQYCNCEGRTSLIQAASGKIPAKGPMEYGWISIICICSTRSQPVSEADEWQVSQQVQNYACICLQLW